MRINLLSNFFTLLISFLIFSLIHLIYGTMILWNTIIDISKYHREVEFISLNVQGLSKMNGIILLMRA